MPALYEARRRGWQEREYQRATWNMRGLCRNGLGILSGQNDSGKRCVCLRVACEGTEDVQITVLARCETERHQLTSLGRSSSWGGRVCGDMVETWRVKT